MSDTKHFSFEHRGETITFEHDFTEVRKPGWLRANRRREELDLMFTIFETVAGDKALAAIDEMTEEEFSELLKAVNEEMGASLGES